MNKTYHQSAWLTYNKICKREAGVLHQLLEFRREGHESRDYALLEQGFAILPAVHVEKLGTMHAHVGALTTR